MPYPVKGCNVETNLTITFRLTEHPCIYDDRLVGTPLPGGTTYL